MEAERIPIRNLEEKKGKSEARLKLVNDLDSKLKGVNDTIKDLASSRGFSDIKLTSGDPNVLGGTVDPANYNPGSWNVEVIELAQKAAALTNGFPDKDKSQLGTGYFVFNTPQGEKEVFINSNESTLEEVANKINKSGVGVKATVINDRNYPEEPYRLMLSGEDVGDEASIEYPTLYFLDGDQDIYFDEVREAKNGSIKVDGFEFAVADNKVTDIIPGVTLQLKQASPGRTVNITVEEDKEVVSGKIKGFVTAMNDVLGFIQTQNRLTKDTDTSKTLGGDSLIRSVESRIRALIQNPQYGIKGDIKRLNQIGIEFNRGGLLEFDEDKFNQVLVSKTDMVQEFFAGDGFVTGFIPSLKNTVKTMTDFNFGPISNRRNGIQNKIDQYNQRIENQERHLEQKEKSLKNKFANLETTMSKLKQQQGQLAALGAGGGSIINFGG